MFTWVIGNGAAVCIVLLAVLCDPADSRLVRCLLLLAGFVLWWITFLTLFLNLSDLDGWEIPRGTELSGAGQTVRLAAFLFPLVPALLLLGFSQLGRPGGWVGGMALVLIHACGTGILRHLLSPYWRLTANRKKELEEAERARRETQAREAAVAERARRETQTREAAATERDRQRHAEEERAERARKKKEEESRNGPRRREAARHQIRMHYLARAERLRWVLGPAGVEKFLTKLGDDTDSETAGPYAQRVCDDMDCLIAQVELRQAHAAVADVVGDLFTGSMLETAISQSMTAAFPLEQVRARVEEYKRALTDLAARVRAGAPVPTPTPAAAPPNPIPALTLRQRLQDAVHRARQRRVDADRDARDHAEAVRRIPDFDSLTAFEKGKRLREKIDQIRRERGENPEGARDSTNRF